MPSPLISMQIEYRVWHLRTCNTVTVNHVLQFAEDYLSAYKITPGIKICNKTWNAFISEITDR